MAVALPIPENGIKTKHGDGWDGVEEVNDGKRGLCGSLKVAYENAGYTTYDDGNITAAKRNLDMFKKQSTKEIPARGKECPHVCNILMLISMPKTWFTE